MKKYWLLLFFIPVILIFVSYYLKNVSEPYWLSINYDPQYAYLFNSMSVAQLDFESIGVYQHPGTTLQVVGAAIIRMVYLVSGEGGLVNDVLRNPEYYLGIISQFLIWLYVLGLISIGILTFIITGNVWLGILIQLSPIFSKNLVFWLIKVRPESLLMFSSLFFVSIIITTFKFDIKNNIRIYTFVFALISGFGIATKITFIPLIAIPLLLLPKFKWKLNYLLGTGMSFVFFTLPIITHYPKLIWWLVRFITHTGKYGTGQIGIINLTQYYQNIKGLITQEIIFSIILFIAVCICIINVISAGLRRNIHQNIALKSLLGVTVAQVIQVIIIAANNSDIRYMTPSLCLSGITFLILLKYVSEINTEKKIIIHNLLHGIFVVLLLFSGYINVQKLAPKRTKNINESLLIYQKIEEDFNGFAKIYYHRSSSPMFALYMGNHWSRKKYSYELQELYPGDNIFIYDGFQNKYYNWAFNSVKIKDILSKYENILFTGMVFEKTPKIFHKPDLLLKDIYGGKIETIYIMDNKI